MTRMLIQNADGSMSSLERDHAGDLSEASPAWGPDPAAKAAEGPPPAADPEGDS